jgi:hypothetical protein
VTNPTRYDLLRLDIDTSDERNLMEAVPHLRSGIGQTPADGGCILQVVDWIDRQGWTDQPECVHPVLRKLAIYVNDQLPDGERQKLLDLTGRLMGTNTGGQEMSVRLAAFCARRVLHIYEEKCPDEDRPRKAIEAAEQWADDPSDENNAAPPAAAAAAANVAASSYASYAFSAANAAYAANAAANAASTAATANVAYAANAAANAAAAASSYAFSAASSYAFYGASYAAPAAAAAAVYQLLVDVLDEYDRLTGRAQVCPVNLGPVTEMLELARA